jgi:hypothetical protein
MSRRSDTAESAMKIFRRLSAKRTLGLCAACALGLAAGVQAGQPSSQHNPPAGAKAAGPETKLVVEPQAMELIKAASQKLAGAKTMSFTATVGYEYPSKLGPPILYTVRYDVTMQRPDKLRVVVPGDGPATQFFYDGKKMIAYAPAPNLAAIVDAPPTIEEALKAAYRVAAIYFPFSDMLVNDPYAALSGGVIHAFYIGQSDEVGGTRAEMVAWANNDVFMQAWIGSADKLPRRIRAVFSEDPLRLRHDMELSNWQLNPSVAVDTFVSVKAQSAGRMAFAAPSPPPPGAKPIIMGKAKQPAPAKSGP